MYICIGTQGKQILTSSSSLSSSTISTAGSENSNHIQPTPSTDPEATNIPKNPQNPGSVQSEGSESRLSSNDPPGGVISAVRDSKHSPVSSVGQAPAPPPRAHNPNNAAADHVIDAEDSRTPRHDTVTFSSGPDSATQPVQPGPNAPNGREILRIDIQLTKDLSDMIVLREGQTIDRVVEEFAWKHALDPAYAPVLVHTITQQLEALSPGAPVA